MRRSTSSRDSTEDAISEHDPAPNTPIDLELIPGYVIRVEDRRLADQLGGVFRLQPGSGRVVCTLQVDRTAIIDGPGPAIAVRGGLVAGCTLVCASSTRPTKILQWINLLLVDAGVLPLHASAFAVHGGALVFAGRAKSGKTGLLLAAAQRGLVPMGDDCTYLVDGCLYSICVPIEVRHRYLSEMPEYRSRLPARSVRRAQIYGGLARCVAPVASRMSRRLDGRAKVVVSPNALLGGLRNQMDVAHLVISKEVVGAAVRIESIDRSDARQELIDIQMAEFRAVVDEFEPPDSDGGRSERLSEQVAALIDRNFVGARVHRLSHPYPVRGHDLVDAVLEGI